MSSPRPALVIRDALIERIMRGLFSQGERLNEERLAQEFNVSRTPLREALQLLSSSGLVRLEHRRGAFVHYPSLDELIEMFEFMADVEALCGRYAAQRIDQERLDRLQVTLDDCEKAADAGDIDAYYIANRDFHRMIYAASGNSFLAAEAERLLNRLAPFRRTQLQARGRMRQSLAEHRAIYEALVDKDADRAAAIVHPHVALQGERFNDLVVSYRRVRQGRG
ncbi:GntR family transcriptional regulator [Paracoccus sp. Z118]|uniref:GntR family transcriptional regulator n=1 Tax=Paracoccus sp. Z118 TaxID=2851017 RepID=UPI001C2C4B29|nr:GntR family transcriptional regulator [Paracoccus sp. Z118]MBV0892049.1 GntR family transcriptional regulator [Paracoccus sp. Z118]